MLPVAYPGILPAKPEEYSNTVLSAVQSLPMVSAAELWVDPGRTLCANYNRIALRVVQRKTANRLYMNDDISGIFSEAGQLKWRYEVEFCVRVLVGERWKISYSAVHFMRGPF